MIHFAKWGCLDEISRLTDMCRCVVFPYGLVSTVVIYTVHQMEQTWVFTWFNHMWAWSIDSLQDVIFVQQERRFLILCFSLLFFNAQWFFIWVNGFLFSTGPLLTHQPSLFLSMILCFFFNHVEPSKNGNIYPFQRADLLIFSLSGLAICLGCLDAHICMILILF